MTVYGCLDMLKNNPEGGLVKYILRKTIGEREEEINYLLNLNHINWEAFKEFLIYNEIAPFAWLALKDYSSFLTSELREFLKNTYYCALVHCQQLKQEFLRILIAFKKAGVSILPVKGIALIEDVYSPWPIRPMSDIDLLVKEENLPEAERVFSDLGYRKDLYGLKEEYWRKKQCHIAFFKRENEGLSFLVELHWSLDFKRRGRYILPELWERIREINVDNQAVKVLSPEDTFFSLALHSRRYGKPLCLKNVYDFVLLLNKYASDFNWDYVLNQGRKYNLFSAIFFMLYQAKLLLNINVPQYVWERLSLPDWKAYTIRRFIEKNIFLPIEYRKNKELYLKSHFLLYDSLWEPAEYILNIPLEQFARYYNLEPYNKRTEFFYRWRFFYIPWKYATKRKPKTS